MYPERYLRSRCVSVNYLRSQCRIYVIEFVRLYRYFVFKRRVFFMLLTCLVENLKFNIQIVAAAIELKFESLFIISKRCMKRNDIVC